MLPPSQQKCLRLLILLAFREILTAVIIINANKWKYCSHLTNTEASVIPNAHHVRDEDSPQEVSLRAAAWIFLLMLLTLNPSVPYLSLLELTEYNPFIYLAFYGIDYTCWPLPKYDTPYLILVPSFFFYTYIGTHFHFPTLLPTNICL